MAYSMARYSIKRCRMKSKWLNNTIIRYPLLVIRPCHKLRYCPYGELIEEYPLNIKGKYSCKVFGHDCPAYYLPEDTMEEGKC